MQKDRECVLSRRARFIALALASAGIAAEAGTTTAPHDAGDGAADASSQANDEPLRPRPGLSSALEAARAGNPIAVQSALEGTRAVELLEFPAAVADLETECERRKDMACSIALLVARHAASEGKLPEAERARMLERIEQLRPQVARLELSVLPNAGEVIVNDVSFGSAAGERVIYLQPGKYEVWQITYGGTRAGRASTHFVALSAGGSAQIEIEARPELPPMVCLQPPPPPPERPRGCGCEAVGRG